MHEYRSQVYQKPKNEFDQTFEDQVKQKKQRLWAGKVIPQIQEDSDDDIFDIKKQENKPTLQPIHEVNNQEQQQQQQQQQQQEQQQEKQSFIEIENDNIKVEIVDEDAALMRRRRLIQSRLAEEQEIQQQNQIENQSEKKEKKKKEKKHKKEKQKHIKEEAQFNQQQILQEQEEEDEHKNEIQLLRPVFVSRQKREQFDKSNEEEIRLKEEKEKNIERMKLENKILILNTVRASANVKVNEDSEDDGQQMLNDEDTLDPTEYALWKIRELKRIKQFNEEKTKYEREKQEIERRRNLTDMQRIQEDFKLGSDKTKIQDKSQYVFMQKYYNVGAYYQDSDDPIFQRDYNLPVGEDLWRKDNLPSILQKRRGQFGKKGNSKYTHLTAEDTTNFDPSYQTDANIRQQFLNKQAGSRTSNKF